MSRQIAKWVTALCVTGILSGIQTGSVLAEETFSYEDVANLEFCFSSGAGGWSNILYIHEDGSFEGTYHDSEMGIVGEEYPNGTLYLCNFSGQFSELVKVNEYTYAAIIESMEWEKEAGTSEIIDGVQYLYSDPYGLNDADRILFYLEGAPLEKLPEGFLSWVGYYDLSRTEETSLPFTGLYNEAAEQGFSSYEMRVAAIDMELEEIAAQATKLQEQIDKGTLSQSELNQLSSELYMLWDNELNSIWGRLKERLSESAMSRLTDEELEWIFAKEASVAAAGAEFQGGSMQPFVENTTAARITRERVYELADYLR